MRLRRERAAGRRGETHSPLDVRLCPAFWRPAGLRVSDRFFRAGVVLHEMVHQLFGFVGDISDVSRRVNAHCYEAFAMRLASPAGMAASLATPTPSSYRTCTDYSLPVSRRTAKDLTLPREPLINLRIMAHCALIRGRQYGRVAELLTTQAIRSRPPL